jgi:hypothetical protein
MGMFWRIINDLLLAKEPSVIVCQSNTPEASQRLFEELASELNRYQQKLQPNSDRKSSTSSEPEK